MTYSIVAFDPDEQAWISSEKLEEGWNMDEDADSVALRIK